MAATSNRDRIQKERLYELFAQLARAMANPHRLELLDLLVQAPRTVEELAQEAHMSLANTSQHLQRLKQARLVTNEREGLYVRYRLADPGITDLWLKLRSVAENQLAEVDRALDAYRPRRHEFRLLPVPELLDLMQAGEIVLLDVRPRVEFLAGHLPGAISIPLEELEHKLDELPRDKTIVAYCRGPFCVFADQALDLLSRRGWTVARLEEGIAEWQIAGNLLER
jgi:rhodanese-related sulfurtransferase